MGEFKDTRLNIRKSNVGKIEVIQMNSVQNDLRQKMLTEWNLWKTFKRPNSNEKEMGGKDSKCSLNRI